MILIVSGVLLSSTCFVFSVNFDHTYWTIDGSGSQYNYVESALKNGHAIFIYDRLSEPPCVSRVSHSTLVADIPNQVSGMPPNQTASRKLRYQRK
jgi:hypothetical protein